MGPSCNILQFCHQGCLEGLVEVGVGQHTHTHTHTHACTGAELGAGENGTLHLDLLSCFTKSKYLGKCRRMGS